ncbi:MAG: response regulator [Anaerolineales bacterium]|nr:response regulator [Anaerolineales bacterium]
MADKIRVLIVDDIAETRDNIRRLLQFERDMEVVGGARTGKEALTLARESQPHVVIMDINMPDMDGISATEAMLKELPNTQIVILSVQNEPDYMRRAMLAGARDFLPKPPSADELVATIRKVGQRALAQPMVMPVVQAPGAPAGGGAAVSHAHHGKVIVVYSPRGGVGRTMVSTNLAISLQTADTPTVVVDAALQFGDVSACLNLQTRNSLIDLVEQAGELDAELVERIAIHHPSGLKVIAAPARPEQAEAVQGAQISKVIRFLTTVFQYVVVDTSAALNEATIGAIDASDVVLLIGAPDLPTIKNLRMFFDLGEALSLTPQKIILIMNRMDKRFGISAEKVADLLKQPIVSQIPLDDRVVPLSTNNGEPFILQDRTKPVARAILEMAQAIKTRLAEIAQAGQQEERKPAAVSKIR